MNVQQSTTKSEQLTADPGFMGVQPGSAVTVWPPCNHGKGIIFRQQKMYNTKLQQNFLYVVNCLFIYLFLGVEVKQKRISG